MAIKIDPAAKLIRDSRITLVRVLKTLNDRLVDGDAGIVAKVKATMLEKGATYAESDSVIAVLKPGTVRRTIDPRKLHKLVSSGALKLTEFLDCCTVSRKALEEFLPGATIDKLEEEQPAGAPSLVTEFRPGVKLDVDAIAISLAGILPAAMPIKTG